MVGLILATAIMMFITTIIGFESIGGPVSPDFREVIIFAVLVTIALVCKLTLKRKPSPIVMILISAALGMAVYSI